MSIKNADPLTAAAQGVARFIFLDKTILAFF